MSWKQARLIALAILGGLLFFRLLLGTSIYLAVLNMEWTPNVPWYPIPALILIIVASYLVHRQWDIGLTIPRNMPLGRIYMFGIAISVTGFAVATLQGSYNGEIRGTNSRGEDLSTLFLIVNAFALSLASAASAELGFRGIMLPRLQKVISMWPAILIVATINTLAHRPVDLSNRWLGLFVMLAGWGYMRHISGSVVPPLVTHVGMNILLATGFWFWGPWDLGAMDLPLLISFAALAIISFAVAFYSARSVKAQR